MKNQTATLRYEASAELKAKKAIQQIQKWIERRHPKLAGAAKTQMIIECLIELTEEKKFLAHS